MPREAWLRQGSSFQKQKADHSTAHSFKSPNQLVKVMTNMANMCPSEPFQRVLDEAVLCHTQPQDTMISFWGRGFTQFGHLPIQRDPLSLDQNTRVRLLTLSGSSSAWGNPMAQAKPVQFRPAASASWFLHVAVLLAAGIIKTLCQQMGACGVDGSACHDLLIERSRAKAFLCQPEAISTRKDGFEKPYSHVKQLSETATVLQLSFHINI